ncbi:extracellular solute-binding protein family 3 [Gloeothece citriformis PCC 7424]|uniref:Extracellular solute-binding protein family 3 n=1 Tax=Gloeothece citriformis (strain PCC 7424) TaxID=65393 RepID=B7KA54_GLOC7|nr:amino acid ABC transporter substrate-binding protein [Gloeothece citriformis]ACK71410.1 extracellular solute-binding protein family 3 [Gloeothece citriformis PCC 7424]
MREDAVPFGYEDLDNNLSGICLDVINLIKERVQEELNQEIILVKLFQSTLFNRFELIKDGVVYLECGPNTIRESPDLEVAFSAPFFVTGTQFIIPSGLENRFDADSSLADFTLGVLRNTTTQQLLASRYPQATIQEFQGITGRLRGIQAVQTGRIDAFASDGILLIGEATLQGLPIPEDYVLVPQPPLDCEYYGLILPKNDPQWRELVNSVIDNVKLKEILRKWVTVISPYLEETRNFCEKKD